MKTRIRGHQHPIYLQVRRSAMEQMGLGVNIRREDGSRVIYDRKIFWVQFKGEPHKTPGTVLLESDVGVPLGGVFPGVVMSIDVGKRVYAGMEILQMESQGQLEKRRNQLTKGEE